MKPIDYQEVNETFYTSDTPDELIKILETARTTGERLSITYGNIQTGKPWDDTPAVGIVGRATNDKIPLLMANSRSMGGEAILTNSILKITGSHGTLIYQGPKH